MVNEVSRSRVTRQVVLTGAVLALLAAAGCARAEPGVVAYVGDQEISQARLDQAVAGATTALGQPVAPGAVITALIHGELSQEIATSRNLSLTDTARNTLLKGSNVAPLLTVPDAVPLAYDIADQQIVSQDLGSGYLTEIAKIPVKLNPRFGVLDPTDQSVVSNSSGSLAKALPTPVPVETP